MFGGGGLVGSEALSNSVARGMGRKKGPREASVQTENAHYKTVNYMG